MQLPNQLKKSGAAGRQVNVAVAAYHALKSLLQHAWVSAWMRHASVIHLTCARPRGACIRVSSAQWTAMSPDVQPQQAFKPPTLCLDGLNQGQLGRATLAQSSELRSHDLLAHSKRASSTTWMEHLCAARTVTLISTSCGCPLTARLVGTTTGRLA